MAPIDQNQTQLHIKLQPGDLAPRYPSNVSPLDCQDVVITERGTASGLPLVDFRFKDDQGREFFFAVTGRLVISLAAAIRGVNLRNHGKEEP